MLISLFQSHSQAKLEPNLLYYCSTHLLRAENAASHASPVVKVIARDLCSDNLRRMLPTAQLNRNFQAELPHDLSTLQRQSDFNLSEKKGTY